MVATFKQLGTQRASYLIPTVMFVVVSIWGCSAFKFFDPGGLRSIFCALAKVRYVQSNGWSILSDIPRVEGRGKKGSVALRQILQRCYYFS